MIWLVRATRRFRGLVSPHRGRDVHDELQFHLDALAEEYRAAGLSDEEARARAQREFGNMTRVAEEVREVRTFPWLEGLLRDVAVGARQLRKHPSVTAFAILSLALGVGANTAVFSIVNGLALRTLPVPQPDRLAALSLGDQEVTRVDGSRWSYGFWQAFTTHRDHFDGMMAWSPIRLVIGSGESTESVQGVLIDGSYFATLDVPAAIGRTIEPGDDRAGSSLVAVISHGYWVRRFGAVPDVLGTTISVQDTPITIVGVTAPTFSGLEVGQSFDVALPLAAEPVIRGTQSFLRPPFDRMNMWLRIGVRLKADQTLDSGSQLVRGLQPQLLEASIPQGFPQLRETFLKEPLSLVDASTGMSRLRQLYRRPLALISIIVALVLILACVNVANLLLAQATARGHELGIRLALGGSRWRIARQLLVESALLTSLGMVVGLAVATVAARTLVAQFSTGGMPVSLDVGLDWRVLAFTSLAGTVTTLVCGTAAALRVNGVTPMSILGAGARGVVGGRRAWVPSLLLGLQVTFSLALVVIAGLFIGSFSRLTQVPLGFDRDRVLLVNASVAQADVRPAERGALYQRFVETVGMLPGVQYAAASTSTPVSATNAFVVVRPGADTGGSAVEPGEAKTLFVTPGWFATYGLPLYQGRDISTQDAQGSLAVMVVNQAFVDRFFPGSDAIGATTAIALGRRGEMPLPSRTIVGIVGNSIYWSLRESPEPTIYVPLAQYDYPVPMNAFIAVAVRTTAAHPGSLTKDVSSALTAINPRLTLTARTLASQVRDSIQQERLLASLSSLFGVVSLLLAAFGLFGVTFYSVARRRAEIAVRIAVGARRLDVIRTVLSRVLAAVGVGVVAGVILSIWLSRLVASLLFGVTPGDPATISFATFVLLSVALCAAVIPANRAHRIDPVEVLRVT